MRKTFAKIVLFVLLWAGLATAVWRLPAVGGGLAAFIESLAGEGVVGRREIEPGWRREAERLRLEVARLREAERRVVELERLLHLPRSGEWLAIAAPVVARDPFAWELSFRIGRGSADGVRVGAAVVAGGELVGRVASTARHSAMVQTLAAPACRLGVKLPSSGSVGILGGQAGGRGLLLIDYLDRDAIYQSGDEVFTSGLSEIIPGGIPVGRVVPWDNDQVAKIVTGSYAQLRLRSLAPYDDFRLVWVVSGRSPGPGAGQRHIGEVGQPEAQGDRQPDQH